MDDVTPYIVLSTILFTIGSVCSPAATPSWCS